MNPIPDVPPITPPAGIARAPPLGLADILGCLSPSPGFLGPPREGEAERPDGGIGTPLRIGGGEMPVIGDGGVRPVIGVGGETSEGCTPPKTKPGKR